MVAIKDVTAKSHFCSHRRQKSEVRSQTSEVRGQKSDVRSQRSEVRGQKSDVRSQKSVKTKSYVDCWFLNYSFSEFLQSHHKSKKYFTLAGGGQGP